MGKQKYTAKEKKVSRMTRNGLVEENLATKETRKVTNSDQELPYKQKDIEQAFITSEKKKNSHKKAEKKQFSEKVQEGNPAKKEEAANSPPGKRKTQGRYRYRDKPAGVSVDSAVEIRERKEKHRSQYQRQKKKQQRLQFGKLETDGSLKKEKKTSAETDGGHFQAEKNDVSTNRKKGKQKYSRKTIKTYQEVDKAARKQEAERQNKIPKDSVYTKKTNEEQKAKVKYHLYFDKKTGKTDGKKKTLSSVPKKALKNAVYQKAGEDEEENSAVDAAHKLVRSGEWILQEHSSRNIRKNRSQIHKENRLEQRAWKSASRYQYQKYLEEHPEMQKKLIRKLIQKQRIKREYQMAYRAGKIAKETKDTSIRSVNLATKIARKAQEVFVRNVTTLISMGLLLILLLSVMTGFASCSAMFSNGISTVIASSYIADPDEIEKAELYYTQLEASLQQKINQMEARYPGKDEYRYNIGEIGHDPHTLISYLTARYGDFKFDEIKGELETIFSLQYGITVEEKSETRQETSTIQVGQSLGNVVTSGYCNCPICCGVWSGGPTASGAMPQANHTLAVDAANPFLPMGTKVVMNGIEYTVEDTGNFAQYGVQFDVYYDNHAVAEAHGHQTWECFLAEGNQNSVEVTRTVTADVLNVSVQAKPLRSVILSRMEEDEQEIYEEVYSNRGNLQTYKTPVASKLLCASEQEYIYESIKTEISCHGELFTASGKNVLQYGWKEVEERFFKSYGKNAEKPEEEESDFPDIKIGQVFECVVVKFSEHFTAPPKHYTEDTLLSAMEHAGSSDTIEDAERKGLGTPATRAAIIEKLIEKGFIERKKKQILPTADGRNLIRILPEMIKSPKLTAEWENDLTLISRGQKNVEEFLFEIEKMVTKLVSDNGQPVEEYQKLFSDGRKEIGKCPRCDNKVYVGKRNYYCSGSDCSFTLWKNNRFFESQGKTLDEATVRKLLSEKQVHFKDLVSEKTKRKYEATIKMEVSETGNPKFQLIFPERKKGKKNEE